MSKNFTNANKGGPLRTVTDTWITPKWIIDATGPYDLDPCGHLPDGKPIVETASLYFTKEKDGLIQPWFGNVFVNFPYSDANSWMKKCREEFESGRVESITVLCFARTETQAWQRNVKFATGINFINKRIRFLNGEGIEKGNGNAPSCLIAFGEKAFRRIQGVDGIITRMQNFNA